MKTGKSGAFGLLIVGLIHLSGCDSLRQEVDPDRLNREAAKLVVTCFLSPQDTVLAVKITRSQPVLGETPGFSYVGAGVPDVTVTLSESSQSATLRYDYQRGYYRAAINQLPIVAGKTYSIVVQTPAGERATSTCTIPELVPVNDILIDTVDTREYGHISKQYQARLRWRDPAGKPNYYQLAGDNEYVFKGQYVPRGSSSVRDTLYKSQGNWRFEKGSTTTDQGRDGQDIESVRGRLATNYSYTNGKQDLSRLVGRLNAYLFNVDENYYRYYDAIERQSQVSGNPFSEPVPVPSNIQGGLGCFAGYNRSTLTVMLK